MAERGTKRKKRSTPGQKLQRPNGAKGQQSCQGWHKKGGIRSKVGKGMLGTFGNQGAERQKKL